MRSARQKPYIALYGLEVLIRINVINWALWDALIGENG